MLAVAGWIASFYRWPYMISYSGFRSESFRATRAVSRSAISRIAVTLGLAFIVTCPATSYAVNKTFSWNAPTLNADGTPLTDLAGYEVAWGSSTRNYSTVRNVNNVLTTVVDLPAGTYFASVRAYDLSGNRSSYSNEITFTVTTTNRCDVNGSGATDVGDVQLSINQAIGTAPCSSADINLDGLCTVIDVQRIVNNALGGACVSP